MTLRHVKSFKYDFFYNILFCFKNLFVKFNFFSYQEEESDEETLLLNQSFEEEIRMLENILDSQSKRGEQVRFD